MNVTELIIDDWEGEKMHEALYYTPQDAFEAAVKWLKDYDPDLEDLPPLYTWHDGLGWREGFQYILSDFSQKNFRLVIVERQIYPLTA